MCVCVCVCVFLCLWICLFVVLSVSVCLSIHLCARALMRSRTYVYMFVCDVCVFIVRVFVGARAHRPKDR